MTTTRLEDYRRIVVKVGSALLVDRRDGLRRQWVETLCRDIAALRESGSDVIIVSSGSIALGRAVMRDTGLGHDRGLKLEESQALASIGQIALAKDWSEALSEKSLVAGQILLTLDDTKDRRRYLNARATIQQLLEAGAVPVINENDSVATNEIRYGDNDRLAARVASMAGADLLVLLSDVDGLYTAPPDKDPDAQFLPHIAEITADIEAMAGDAGSDLSRGGMKTKIEAGRIATKAGCAMIIASGKRDHPLRAIAEGARHSHFEPDASPVTARKKWIAGQLDPAGRFFVDTGALEALKSGKSLLPAGVRKVTGSFARGDTVAICDHAGFEFARGLAAYGADEAVQIAGRKSSEIAGILGYSGRAAMVHRDDMVLTGAQIALNEDE
ncbi:glutamate 5-kinase [Hoeflea sp.]|uniref:glutamate 5-kinase n=1 Tax=Hoeflea sp. TaxID=1940281 RepID=UPI003B018DD4